MMNFIHGCFWDLHTSSTKGLIKFGGLLFSIHPVHEVHGVAGWPGNEGMTPHRNRLWFHSLISY